MTKDDLKLVANQPDYYEFIRQLRNNHQVSQGIVDVAIIAQADRQKYVQKYAKNFFICLVGDKPVGYIGSIDNDIRIAVMPEHQKQGVGLFMVKEFVKRNRPVVAKIKISDLASRKLFEKAGFKLSHLETGYQIYKPGKKIAIIQSAYIPWKGYFDIIKQVDEFVILDDVQFSTGGFCNRNRIMSEKGACWLTIPICRHFPQAINKVLIADKNWADSHWSSLVNAYKTSPYFHDYKNYFHGLYLKAGKKKLLTEVNQLFIEELTRLLEIDTKIKRSEEIPHSENRVGRIVSICKSLESKEYLSGPAADYLNKEIMAKKGIRLDWMDYTGYKEYKQLFEPFEHQVSIIDLIFNTGPRAKEYITAQND